ncbi:MFS transporter [Burkholderia cenocepacia]|uniref:MFS transporter n=1 Tax=Burkholderia cenocepacia TaxID=95486 RepID=UPI001F4B109A|nr:MFS transporter [Burkholderia cenocepacia]
METLVSTVSPAARVSEDAAYRKVAWRLMPLLLFCYLVSYLDRVNVGFAKLQMAGDLGLSDAAYGLGAGIFFFGYFIFEVPSNLILHRIGARVWIARIMVTWGAVSALTMFVTTPTAFYAMRFLLGAAEAGFFPGVILYLTYWYPAHRRGRITTVFMTAVALSGVVGGPISGYILKAFDGINAWHGWQWLYLLEGLPSIVAGLLVYALLDDRIAQAKWLNDQERALLERNVNAEDAVKSHLSLGAVLANPRLWLMCAIYFSFVIGLYGVGFWLPTLIHATGVADPLTIGLLSTVPYALAVVAMIVIARSSDRLRERRWHLAVPGAMGTVGLVLAVGWAHQTGLAIAALTLATMGILTAIPLFWSLPTAFLGGAAAAAGIAMINSIGNLAGFLSPYLMGWLKQVTGANDAGMYMLAGFLVLGGLLALSVPKRLVDK